MAKESILNHAGNASVDLANLLENTLYRLRISVTDEAGNTATYVAPLDQFSFGTGAGIILAQNAFEGVTANFPNKLAAALMHRLIFPLGRPYVVPSDQLGHEVARLPNPYQRSCVGATSRYTLLPDGGMGVVNTCATARGRCR